MNNQSIQLPPPGRRLWRWARSPASLLGGVLFATLGSHHDPSSFSFSPLTLLGCALGPKANTNGPVRKPFLAEISPWPEAQGLRLLPSTVPWNSLSSPAVVVVLSPAHRMGCLGLAESPHPTAPCDSYPAEAFLRRKLRSYRNPHDRLVLRTPEAPS